MAMVLVVDDEPDICELLRLSLELDGHHVTTAPDGLTALDTLRCRPLDLVILDVMMPGMDGWEVLRRIKSEPDRRVAEVPVVIFSARADALDRVRGGIEGAIRYLTKPFAEDELRAAVEGALGGDPEPLQRRQAQHAALEWLARLEKGDAADGRSPAPRPRLTRFEALPLAASSPRRDRAAGVDLSVLSVKQAGLLAAVGRTRTVRDAAVELEVSRSNVYASLRRIARKLDVHSVPELVRLARNGTFDVS